MQTHESEDDVRLS